MPAGGRSSDSFKACAELPAFARCASYGEVGPPIRLSCWAARRLGIERRLMEHPSIIRPGDHAEWRSDRMGKTTLFQSKRLLIGLNSFEPGQFHALHSHEGMDKVYQVLEGEGMVLVDGRELPIKQGELVVAPEGVPHGIRNTGTRRLLVLAVLAPSP
jgi:mannose-6-phosphate isomerase-like protein (cupin superfamily)